MKLSKFLNLVDGETEINVAFLRCEPQEVGPLTVAPLTMYSGTRDELKGKVKCKLLEVEYVGATDEDELFIGVTRASEPSKGSRKGKGTSASAE